LLIIEVADSSLAYDRAIKRALYARHGIPEFWIVNLQANTVEVCRTPSGETYANISIIERDGILEPELISGATIPAAVLLG
jgi:Uma2 family endonuclease